MSHTLRVLPNIDKNLSARLLTGSTVQLRVPVENNINTAPLFESSVFDWHYCGQEPIDTSDVDFNERHHEHYFQEMNNDPKNPYSNRYVNIGAFTYGLEGDAVAINGIAAEIKTTWLEKKSDCDTLPSQWEWVVIVATIKS